METEINTELPPLAIRQVADALVKLYSTENDSLFSITVRDETVSVLYKKTPPGRLRYTVYNGDTSFFNKLSPDEFYNVERAVYECLRDADYREKPF
ncbi:hypothetical protein BLA23254_06063 [Burkholderia lata]|uniref:Uncharacterized protein n=1 Tax=Burkholderia lata (strain ATCC 17760 / DSM 23089 / LMG 22485 / NCIMB 9086 / R18194 / 383) TaxID=482957 RepID=A0A6P2R2M0_BURL3|nr:hypothetical protein [Burkholderia lata]VWC25945.1 hypothetical protein BLA23254_06063 [Burkholderia lata]